MPLSKRTLIGEQWGTVGCEQDVGLDELTVGRASRVRADVVDAETPLARERNQLVGKRQILVDAAIGDLKQQELCALQARGGPFEHGPLEALDVGLDQVRRLEEIRFEERVERPHFDASYSSAGEAVARQKARLIPVL